MYIASRAFLGFGIAPCIVSGSALIGELAYPKERPIMTSLFNTCYHIGALLGAGISFGCITLSPSHWSWRLPCLFQALPSLMQIIFIFFIPESPRYLITKDRREEAYNILAKYHAEGDRSSPVVAAEFAQIETTIKIETENAKRSWKDMLSTHGNQKRFLIGSLLGLFTQWSGELTIPCW
jgi:MFS family permease